MNGAKVIVEKIILHDREDWAPLREVHPNVIQLRYMPAAVIVRVPNVEWELPPEALGPLYYEVSQKDRKGIFIVYPDTSKSFKWPLHGIKWKVKRTQLNLIPANSIIV